MYSANFRYHRATRFEEASAALVSFGHNAKFIAGGQSLIPLLKLRLLQPSDLIDLSGIADADHIEEIDRSLEIGALARHAVVGKSNIAARYPIISDCALGIADVQVRNMGTIGGSLAGADPNCCWPTLLVALDARVHCIGPSKTREQSVRELLTDAYTPNLEFGELIDRVIIDKQALLGFGTFVAFKRCAPAYPTASCALSLTYDGDRVAKVRMGFGCVAQTPLAFDAANEILRGRALSKDLIADVAQLASEFVDPISDNKGTEVYKRSLVKGLVRRAFDIVERRRLGSEVKETHFYYG
jgi:carbon-monoxide dehydrogenase medium subunit